MRLAGLFLSATSAQCLRRWEPLLLALRTTVCEFGFGRFGAGGDKNAVEAAFAGIVVELASDIFSDFAGGDGKLQGAFVAEVHDTLAGAHGRDGIGCAASGERTTSEPR